MPKKSSSRGDDRDRGVDFNPTDYTSTSQNIYSNTSAPSIASSYATAAMNPIDYQTMPPDLVRSNTFPEQTSNTRYRRDDEVYKEPDYRKEKRSDHGEIKEERKKSRDNDDRDEDKRERRERRERKKDLERVKDRGILRSDTYPPSTSRGPGDFSAQVHGSGFTQFPGQYDGGFMSGPSPRPQHNEPLSSHVPDQFPGQFSSESSRPYRPPLAKSEGGPGLASEYYGDSGQSVQDQPGVRPNPPPLIIGSEPHLQPASAVEAPPPEPSSLGQMGAAASFYNSNEDFGPSSGPTRPNQQPNSSQAPTGGYHAVAPLAGAVAAGMVASNATFSQSNSHYSEQISYQSRPSTSAPSIAPSNTTYYSTSTSMNPVAGAVGAAAAGTAAGYVLGHQSSSSSQAPQVPMMSGALNSTQQSSYQAAQPSSRPPTSTQQTSSAVNPVLGAVGAAAAGAAAGYFLGNHGSGSNQDHAQPSTNGSFQGRPSDQRPPPQPLPYHQGSQSFTGDVHASYTHESSHANGASHHSSNAPLYAAGLAGAAGLAAASMHNGHSNSHHDGRHSPRHDSFSYSHGSMAQQQHRKYHQHQGPLDKFVDFWRDSYAVGQYEDYTEYIGVCRYCFSPGSSSRDAPRRHHYGRRKSSYERLNAASRVSKDYRRYSSSSDSDRERKNKNKSWLAAGLGTYGLGTVGKKLFAVNHGFDDTYSVQSGKPVRTSSKERRSYGETGFTNMPGSYPGDERHGEIALAATKTSAADANRWSRTYEQTRRSRSRSRDRKLGLDASQTDFVEASLKQKYRSRSRSRDRKAAIVGGVAGAAVAGTVLSSMARNGRSPEMHRERYHHHPPVGYVEVRRDGRHETSHSTLSQHRADLVEVSVRDNHHSRNHSTSPNRRKRKTKKSKGFFSFSNSSSSSADSTLAFGAVSDRRKSKKDHLSHKKSSDKTDAAIMGLGAAAAAIALQQSHQNGKGKLRTDAPSLTKPHQIYAADGRKDSHGRYGHHHGPDADGWESASDDDHSSIDSMLAYGLSRRSSRESLRSNSSGTEKWGWRWGGEKKSKKQRHHDSSVPALGAVAAGAVGGAIAAEGIHRHQEQGRHPVGSNVGLPPMQHVFPYSTNDPAAFDATRHNSTVSPNQPLTTVRPSPLPLQQPQPISQVSTSVLTSIAPLDHSYSAPAGSAVYNSAYQPQNAPPRVLPSAVLPPGHDSMPGSFPTQPNIPHDIQPVIKEISPRRRASTPPDPSKINYDVIRNTTGIDVSPNVRFNLTQEDEDRERRDKRRRKKEDKARRVEAERLEQQQQAEMDEAEYAAERAAQQATNPPHAIPVKFDGTPGHENVDRQWESERRSRSDSHPATVNQTSTWVAPALAGAASAAVGAAIIHEIEPRYKDRSIMDRDDEYVDVEKHKDHHDDKYQEVYQRVMHDYEDSKKPSHDELSEEERRAEKKRARFAREAARRISRTPSPVYSHEKYSDYFQLPPGTSEAAREAEEEKKSYGVPDADNEILRYRILPLDVVMKAEQKTPKAVYNAHGELMDSSRMMPWRVAPTLNLVEPTPPGSIAGSVRGDASPIIYPATELEIIRLTDIEETAKEISNQRLASKVRFGDNETQEYEVITPEGHREEFIESTYKPLKRNYAADSTKSTSRSPSPEEIIVRDHARYEHMPGEFGDDIDFTATVAAGLEDSGFPSSIVVDDPSFRKRDSPPGSDTERPSSSRRDINSVSQSPFHETVTDPGKDVTRVKGDSPHNETKGANVMDFLVEQPAEHMVEIKPKGDAKTKDTAKKRSLRDVIGIVGAAGATSALANAASSSPPAKPREVPDAALDATGVVFPEVKRHFTISPKPRGSKREDSSSPKQQAAIDNFYDASDFPRPSFNISSSASRPSLNDDSKVSRPEPEAIPLPVGDDEELEARELYDDARIDASEARQMRALGEYEIADVLQPKEMIQDDAFEETRKSKKSKRRSTTDFDETASVTSAPTVIERSPETNGESKGKSKKERKSSLFGIFSKSSEDVSEKSKEKGKSKTDDFYDYDEPTKKSKKSKGRRFTGDDYDDDVQSRVSEPVPAVGYDEVSKKGKKGKERRSTRDDFYDDDVLSRASEPTPTLENEESGKKSRKSKDRKALRSDYDDDALSRASEPVPTMPGLDDAEDDIKSRKKRDKDEKRKLRKESKMDREPGRITQELPAKVHLPAFPAASSSLVSETSLLTDNEALQNGDSDETVLNYKEDRRREDLLLRDQDQDQSFLGERQERKRPPDNGHGESRIATRESLQRSKDVEAALHALDQGRPVTPESDGSQREVQSTPSHRRRVSMLQSSDSFDGTSTPSPTAIPISFRMGARPSSLQLTRSSPSAPTLASIQPDTPKARKQRPKSGEIRRSTEIRPLFLVEKHSVRQEPVLEDRYPSLPSSHTTSRASSVHDGGDEEDVVARLVDREHRKGSYHEWPMDLDTGHYTEADLLDSQQATPTAISFREAGEYTNDQLDLGYPRDRRFSQGEVPRDIIAQAIPQRRPTRTEKGRRRSESFLKNVAGDQLAGGAAALEALRYINTPSTRLHEHESFFEEATRDSTGDKQQAERHDSRDQLSQGPAFSAESFDTLEEGQNLDTRVEKADVSQVATVIEPPQTPVSSRHIEFSQRTPVTNVEPQIEAGPLGSSSIPVSLQKETTESSERNVEPQTSQVGDENEKIETVPVPEDFSPVKHVEPLLETVQPSEPMARHEDIHSTEKPGYTHVLSKDMSTAAIVATMATAASAAVLDQHSSGDVTSAKAPIETDTPGFESMKPRNRNRRSTQAKGGDWELLDMPEDMSSSHIEINTPDTPLLRRQADISDACEVVEDVRSIQDNRGDESIENFVSSKGGMEGMERPIVPSSELGVISQEKEVFADSPADDTVVTADSIAPARKDKKGKKSKRERLIFDDFEETVPIIEEQPREVLPLERALSSRSLALPEGDDLDLEETDETDLPSNLQTFERDLPILHDELVAAHETQPNSAGKDVSTGGAVDRPESLAQDYQLPGELEDQTSVLEGSSRELPTYSARHADAEVAILGETPLETPIVEPLSETPIERAETSTQEEPPLTAQDDNYFGFPTTKKAKKGKKGRKSETSTPLEESVTSIDKLAAPEDVPIIEGNRNMESAPALSEVADQDPIPDNWSPSTSKKKKCKKGQKRQATFIGDDNTVEETKSDPADHSEPGILGEEASTIPMTSDETKVGYGVPLIKPMQIEESATGEWPTSGKKKGRKAKRQSMPFEEVAVADEITHSESLNEPEVSRDMGPTLSTQDISAQQPEIDEWAPNQKKSKKGKKNQTFFPLDESTSQNEAIMTPSEPFQSDADRGLDSPSLVEGVQIPQVDDWAPSTSKKKRGKKTKKGFDLEEPATAIESMTLPIEAPLPEMSRDIEPISLSEEPQNEGTRTPIVETDPVVWASTSTKSKGKKGKKGKGVVLDLGDPLGKPIEEASDQRELQSPVPSSLDRGPTTGFQPEVHTLDALPPSLSSENQENIATVDESAPRTESVQATSSKDQFIKALTNAGTVEPSTPIDAWAPTSRAEGKKGRKGKRTSSNISSPVADRRQSTDDWMDAALDEPAKFEEPNLSFEDTETVAFDEPEVTPLLVPSSVHEAQPVQEIGQDRSFTPTERESFASLAPNDTDDSVQEIVSDGARFIKDSLPLGYQRPITPEPSESSVVFETPTKYPSEPLHEPQTPSFQRSMSSTSHSTRDSFHEAEEEYEQETPRLRPIVMHGLHDIDVPSQATPLVATFDPSDIALPPDEPSDFEEDAWHDTLAHDVETDLERELVGGEQLQRVVTLEENEPGVGVSGQSETGTEHELGRTITPRPGEGPENQLPAHVLQRADELLAQNKNEAGIDKSEHVQGALDHDVDQAVTSNTVDEHTNQLPAPVLQKAEELFASDDNENVGERVEEGLEDYTERPATPQGMDELGTQLPAEVLSKADQLLHDPLQEQGRGVLAPPHDEEPHEILSAPEGVPQIQDILAEPTQDIEVSNLSGLDPAADLPKEIEPSAPSTGEFDGTEASAFPVEEPEPFPLKKSKKNKRKENRAQKVELIEGKGTSLASESAKDSPLEGTFTPEPSTNSLVRQTFEEEPAREPLVEEPATAERSRSLGGVPPVVEDSSSLNEKKSKKDKRKSRKTQGFDWNEQAISTVPPDQAAQDDLINSDSVSQLLPDQLAEQDKLLAQKIGISKEPAQDSSIQTPKAGSVSAMQEEAVTAEEVATEDFSPFKTKKSKKDKKKSKKTKAFDWNEPDASSSGQVTPGIQSLETSTILPSTQSESYAEDTGDVRHSAEVVEERNVIQQNPSTNEQSPLLDEKLTSTIQKGSTQDQEQQILTSDFDDERKHAPDDSASSIVVPDTDTHKVANIRPINYSSEPPRSVLPEETPVATEEPLAIPEEFSYSLKKSKKDKKKSKRAQNLDLDDEPDLTSSGVLTPITPKEAEQTVTLEGTDLSQPLHLEEPTANEQDDFSSSKKSKKDKKKSKRTQTLDFDKEPDVVSSGLLTPDVASEAPTNGQSNIPMGEPVLQDSDTSFSVKTSKKDKRKSKKSKNLDWLDESQADSSPNPSNSVEPEASLTPPQANHDQPVLPKEPVELQPSLDSESPAETLATTTQEQLMETSAAPDDLASFSTKKGKKDKKKAKRAQTLDLTEEPEASSAFSEPSKDREIPDLPSLRGPQTQITDSMLPENIVNADEDFGFPSKNKGKKDRKKSKQAGNFTSSEESAEAIPKDATTADVAHDQALLSEESESKIQDVEISKEISHSALPDARKTEGPEPEGGEISGEKKLPTYTSENLIRAENIKESNTSATEKREILNTSEPPRLPNYEESLEPDAPVRDLPLSDDSPTMKSTAIEVKNKASSIGSVHDKNDSSILPPSHDIPSMLPIIEDSHQTSVAQGPLGATIESVPHDETSREKGEAATFSDPQTGIVTPTISQEVITALEEPAEVSFERGMKAQTPTWDDFSEVPNIKEPSVGKSAHQNAFGDHFTSFEQPVEEIAKSEAPRVLSDGDLIDESTLEKTRTNVPQPEIQQEPTISLKHSDQSLTPVHEFFDSSQSAQKERNDLVAKDEIQYNPTSKLTNEFLDGSTPEMTLEGVPLLQEPQEPPVSLEESLELATPLEEPLEYGFKKSKKDKKKNKKAQSTALDESAGMIPNVQSATREVEAMVQPTESVVEPVIEPTTGPATDINSDEGIPQNVRELTISPNESVEILTNKSKKDKKESKKAQAFEWTGSSPPDASTILDAPTGGVSKLDEDGPSQAQIIDFATSNEKADEEPLDAAKSVNEADEPSEFSLKRSKKDKRKGKKAQAVSWDETPEPPLDRKPSEQEVQLDNTAPTLPDAEIEQFSTPRDSQLASPPPEIAETDFPSLKKSKRDKKKAKKGQTFGWTEDPAVEPPEIDPPHGGKSQNMSDEIVRTKDALVTEVIDTPEESPAVAVTTGRKSKKDKKGKSKNLNWDEEPAATAPDESTAFSYTIEETLPLESKPAGGEALTTEDLEAFSSKKDKKNKKSRRGQEWMQDESGEPSVPMTESLEGADSATKVETEAKLVDSTQISGPEPEQQDYFSVKPSKKGKKSKQATWDEPVQEVEPLKEIYDVPVQDSQPTNLIEGTSMQSPLQDEPKADYLTAKKGKKDKKKVKGAENEALTDSIMEKESENNDKDMVIPEPIKAEKDQGSVEILSDSPRRGDGQDADDIVMPQAISNAGDSIVQEEAGPSEIEDMTVPQPMERAIPDEPPTATVLDELEYPQAKKTKKDKRKKKAAEETWDEPIVGKQVKGANDGDQVLQQPDQEVAEAVHDTASTSFEQPEFMSKKSKRDKKKAKNKAVSWDEPVEVEAKNDAYTAEVLNDAQPEEIDPTTQVLQELGLQKVDLAEEPTDSIDKDSTESSKRDEVDPTAEVLHELGLEKVELPEEIATEATSEITQSVETRAIDQSADVLQESDPLESDVLAESNLDAFDDTEASTLRKGKKSKKSKQQGLSWDEPAQEIKTMDDANARELPLDVEPERSAEDIDAVVNTEDPKFFPKKSRKDKKRARKAQTDLLEEMLPEVETTVERGLAPIPELIVEEQESSNTVIMDNGFENVVPDRQSSKEERRAKFFDDLDNSMPLGELTPTSEEREFQEPLSQPNVDEGILEPVIVSEPSEQPLHGESTSVIEPLARPSTPPPIRDSVVSAPATHHQVLDEPAPSREIITEDFASFPSTKKRKKPKRMETFDAEANEAREVLEKQHVERPTSQHASEVPEDLSSRQLVRADESHPPLTEMAALLPPIRKRSKKSKKPGGSQYSSENPSTQGEIEKDSLAGEGGLASMIPQEDFYPSHSSRIVDTTVDQQLGHGLPHTYTHQESVEPHAFPVNPLEQERLENDSPRHPDAVAQDAEYRQTLTPPAEYGLLRKSKKGKRKEKEPEVIAEVTPKAILHDERYDKPKYTKSKDISDGEDVGAAGGRLHKDETDSRAALVHDDQPPSLDLPSKRSKRSRKSRDRSPEPIEDEPGIEPKPGVAAGIAAGVALFEGLQRGKSSKKKDRKGAAVDWDDLNPEEHLAGKVKDRRESIEKGARPEEMTRGDIEIPRMQIREARATSQDQRLEQGNRDSGVHFDSPLLYEQSPITRTSIRDSGYQGAEDSPQTSGVLPSQSREMHTEAPKDVEGSQTRFLQAEDRESTDASHRTSMAESSNDPLNISIEVDPGYDISVSRPLGERVHGKHRHRHDEPLHDHLPTRQDVSQDHSIEYPTEVHSTSRDRSSSLFDSSPSTRDHASAYDVHRQNPTSQQVDTLQETSRDISYDQPRPSSHSMKERRDEEPLVDPSHSTQGSLFGGPVGVNSDQVLSPPRTPIESASSRRRRLNTITEQSPEDVHQHKHPRETTDVGLSEPNSKSARRSSTPKTFAQHRVRSPLGSSQLADSSAAGIAGALSTDKIIANMSWPSVDEDNHSVDLDKITKPSRDTSRNSSGQHDDPTILPIKNKSGRRSLSGASVASGDSIRAYIQSPDNPRSVSGTPPLRRSDRSISGDLRAASKRESAKKQAKPYEETGEREFLPDAAIASSSTYDPVKEKGKGRSRDMADVYVSLGSDRITCRISSLTVDVFRRAGATFTVRHGRLRDHQACAAVKVCKLSTLKQSLTSSLPRIDRFKTPKPK